MKAKSPVNAALEAGMAVAESMAPVLTIPVE